MPSEQEVGLNALVFEEQTRQLQILILGVILLRNKANNLAC